MSRRGMCRESSRSENRVIMVKSSLQNSNPENSKAPTTSGKGSNKSDVRSSRKDGGNDKSRKPMAGRMWGSFESDSPSEDDHTKSLEEEEDSLSKKRNAGNCNNVSSDSADKSNSSNDRHHRRRGRLDRNNPGNDPETAQNAGNKPVSAVDMEREEEQSSTREGSHRKFSSGSRKSDHDGFKQGDRVSAIVGFGESSAKGTILAESSGGKYDVILDNGIVEKRVHPEDMSVLADDSDGNRSTSSRRDQATSHTRRESRRTNDGSPRRQDRSLSASKSDVSDRKHDGLTRSARCPSHFPNLRSTETLSGPPLSPFSSEAEAQMASVPSGDGGGSPALQPPPTLVAVRTPDITSTALRITQAAGSEPEELNSGRVLSPLQSSVRQTRGLLKTMFRRQSGHRSGDENSSPSTGNLRNSTRRASREGFAAAASRHFSRLDSGEIAHVESPAALSTYGTDLEVPATSTPTSPIVTIPSGPRNGTTTAGDALNFSTASAGAPTPAVVNTHLASGLAWSLRRRLSRGRTKNRDNLSGKGSDHQSGSATSHSPALRSPSLATKLGMSLRGAILGTTHLGVMDRQGAHRRPDFRRAGSEGDSDSDATYSTSDGKRAPGNKRRGVARGRRRRRRSSTHRRMSLEQHAAILDLAGTGEEELEHELSGDGFDSDIFCPGSPMAPAKYVGDPRNLPEALHSYIGARTRMEQDMSATGPVSLPIPGNLSPNPVGGFTGWGKRHGSLDITRQVASTTQLSEQLLPFTEAMFKAGVSETPHSTKQGILLEGDLQKFSPESVRGVRWHKRYFVLYAGTCELRYYRAHAEAAWGRIPLGERGSIPLRLVVKIEQPSDKKYRGCRFDLVVLYRGEGRHPGLHIRPGHEEKVMTTKTFKFNAADAQQRLLWVTVIEALMKTHGWGLDADRRRRMRAPGHGNIDAGEGLAFGEWGGDAVRGLAKESIRRDSISRRTESHRGSVLTFVEDDHSQRNSNSQDDHRRHARPERMGGTAPGAVRGIRIPFSPSGRKGGLATHARSPPAVATRSRRPHPSLKSDRRSIN